MAQLESNISRTIRKSFVSQTGGWGEKIHQGGCSSSGVADLWLGAQSVCIVGEVKCAKKRPKRLSSNALSPSGSPSVTRLQMASLRKAHAAGFIAGVFLCYWEEKQLLWLPVDATVELGKGFDEGWTMEEAMNVAVPILWRGRETWDMARWFERVTGIPLAEEAA